MKVIIIPARLGSTRLPNKMLLPAPNGQPLIKWVYDRARSSNIAERVIVATDSTAIADCLGDPHASVITDPAITSGTDRIWEAAQKLKLPKYSWVVNWQGDEVTMDASVVDELFTRHDNDEVEITTAAVRISSQEAYKENHVKVVTDISDLALYFSRLPIPYTQQTYSRYLKHVGVYVYNLTIIDQFRSLLPPVIEASEKLEQLRALYHGMKIRTWTDLIEDGQHLAIDVESDYQDFLKRTK